MNFWVWSPSDHSVASSQDSCVLRKPRNSCGRLATSSDLQRPAVARLRSERRPRCLFHFFVAEPSLVVAKRPGPDFEEFL
ncbi:hypothetical protein QL285_026189 [Trifolium repens]|nr:hypothetical protein QL285_026189 [Trifolium repens]